MMKSVCQMKVNKSVDAERDLLRPKVIENYLIYIASAEFLHFDSTKM